MNNENGSNVGTAGENPNGNCTGDGADVDADNDCTDDDKREIKTMRTNKKHT